MRHPAPLLLALLFALTACTGGDPRRAAGPTAPVSVLVGGRPVPVEAVRVAPREDARRTLAMDDKAGSAKHFDIGWMARCRLDGATEVRLRREQPITSLRILPASAGIVPVIEGSEARFILPAPRPVVAEFDGDVVGALQILADPSGAPAPRPGDPGVVYFGPGVHEVSRLVVGDGQQVYLAPGAVVRAVIAPDEQPWVVDHFSGLPKYRPCIEVRGTGVRIWGEGVIDGSACPTHARTLLQVERSRDVRIEGITLLDCGIWTLPIIQSSQVTVSRVKILGYRANSDGVDIVSSSDVTVEDCYVRTLDDLIVVKSNRGQGPAERIAVRRNLLWNEVAHALSVGAELSEPVRDVRFSDNDIIHDLGREWALRIYQCDRAPVERVRFEDIRIEGGRKLASVWVGKNLWTRDPEPGAVLGTVFERIQARGAGLEVEVLGGPGRVDGTAFLGVVRNGAPLRREDVRTDAAAGGVVVAP